MCVCVYVCMCVCVYMCMCLYVFVCVCVFVCSSTFCVHFYYFPALFSVRIPTVFQHCLRAFLLWSSTFLCALLWAGRGGPAVFWVDRTMLQHFCVCISTLLQHFFCVYFHCDPTLFLCVYFYCAPAFFVHAFLLCFSSDTLPTPVLMLFTAWKRHGITMLSLLL